MRSKSMVVSRPVNVDVRNLSVCCFPSSAAVFRVAQFCPESFSCCFLVLYVELCSHILCFAM